jgi:hypothetical protein
MQLRAAPTINGREGKISRAPTLKKLHQKVYKRLIKNLKFCMLIEEHMNYILILFY